MDSWEDWDTEDYEVVLANDKAKEEQAKRLEERKLVEDSDNALTNDLFSDNKKPPIVDEYVAEKKRPSEVKQKPKKRLENEQKQKEASKAAKLLKQMKQRERDIFGEAEDDDEYAEYEDKFY